MTVDILGIILILGLGIGGFLGYRKGFFGTITKPLKKIGAICLTVIVSAPIINSLTRPFFVTKVQNWINKVLTENSGLSDNILQEDLPFVFRLMIKTMNIDISSMESGASVEEVITRISEKMAAPVGNLIAVVVTYVVLFFLLVLLLSVLIALLDAAFAKGTLGKINKVLGLLLGVIIAVVVACIVANIVYFIAPMAAKGAISTFFKNINPFAFLLKI